MSYFVCRLLVPALLACTALAACRDDNVWEVEVKRTNGNEKDCIAPASRGRIEIVKGVTGQTVMSFRDPYWWEITLEEGGNASTRTNGTVSYRVQVGAGRGPRDIDVTWKNCGWTLKPK
jgi:hypothetical protein